MKPDLNPRDTEDGTKPPAAELSKPPREDEDRSDELHRLARQKRRAGDLSGAEAAYLEALKMRRAAAKVAAAKAGAAEGDKTDTREVAATLHHLANVRRKLGKLDAAEKGFTQVLAIERRLHGDPAVRTPEITAALHCLAKVRKGEKEGRRVWTRKVCACATGRSPRGE
jgi:tetratricopeptide (TPR) repeat protein